MRALLPIPSQLLQIRAQTGNRQGRFSTPFRENREAIEAAFGGPLDWARLDDKQASRVSRPISIGGYRSEEAKWPEIQDAMIDAMIRLEQAVRPQIAKLRFGV